MEKFYREIFFPYIDEHGIQVIVDLGDTFEHRKYINFNAFYMSKDFWFDEIAKRNISHHIIVGNHCSYFKNTLLVNSPDLLFSNYSNITVHSSPTEVELGNTKIIMMPWMCQDNMNDAIELMNSTSARVLFGHLELAGFEMYKGGIIEHGMDSNIFDKFDVVCSGHYHHKSTKGNINYLGCPYEMTWSDYNDTKGFHIFDTETLELTFIPNPYTMFIKIFYNDSILTLEEIQDFDFSSLTDTYVKIHVLEKNNPYWFDILVDKLEKANPASIQIIDDTSYILNDSEDDFLEKEDTLTLLKKYLDVQDDEQRNRASNMMQSLYFEAQNLV